MSKSGTATREPSVTPDVHTYTRARAYTHTSDANKCDKLFTACKRVTNTWTKSSSRMPAGGETHGVPGIRTRGTPSSRAPRHTRSTACRGPPGHVGTMTIWAKGSRGDERHQERLQGSRKTAGEKKGFSAELRQKRLKREKIQKKGKRRDESRRETARQEKGIRVEEGIRTSRMASSAHKYVHTAENDKHTNAHVHARTRRHAHTHAYAPIHTHSSRERLSPPLPPSFPPYGPYPNTPSPAHIHGPITRQDADSKHTQARAQDRHGPRRTQKEPPPPRAPAPPLQAAPQAPGARGA